MDLLNYRPLPLVERLRLGYSVLRLTARTDWERMDDIGALDWLRRASGAAAVESVWTPLMLGKFGADSERIPLAWLWSKFRLRRKLGVSGATKEQLGYPRGSFRAICQALATEIRKLCGEIIVDREVIRVGDDNCFVLHYARSVTDLRRAGES